VRGARCPGWAAPRAGGELIATERGPRALGQLLSGNDDGAATVGDRLADPVAEDAYERIPAQVDSDRLRGLLLALDAREYTIGKARFGLHGPERTLRLAGVALGVSAGRWPAFWPPVGPYFGRVPYIAKWTASGRRRQPSSADRGHPGASRPPAACAVSE
jgi:hypothetical protein